MKRYKAYTVIELVVVLVLTGVVMVGVVAAYSLIEDQYHGYVRETDTVQEFYLFKNTLNYDFAKSREVLVLNPREFQLSTDSNRIKYNINSRFLIRTINEVKDTFFLENLKAKYFFNGVEKKESGIIIDELDFSFIIDSRRQHIHLTKQYGADVLLQMEANGDI